MANLQLSNVRKAFGAVTVLDGVDLDIADGEFIVFVGPSGCGKSTLLRAIAGLEDISGGEIRIGGRAMTGVPPARRGVAMVFQSYALYPHMTVYENMAFSLKLAKRGGLDIDGAVREAARKLRIEPLLDRKPRALSGGQRQRVAIGRAIVRKPEVFLFDEPLSNLDAALRVSMRQEFATLHEDLAATMVYVTHDQVEAMTLADRIAVLSAGRIEQVGPPIEVYQHPVNMFVAGFIGSPKMNFIEGHVVERTAAHANVRLVSGDVLTALVDAGGATVGDRVTLGARPEHFEAGAAHETERAGSNAMDVTVRFVESLGSATFAYVALAATDVDLTLQLPGGHAVAAGDTLRARVAPGSCHLFDRDGRSFPRPPGACGGSPPPKG